MASAYDRRYRAERAVQLAVEPRCEFVDDDSGRRCDRPATSADHDPPLKFHVHERGSGCCRLRSACLDHQRKQGAAITNGKLRRLPTPSRRW